MINDDGEIVGMGVPPGVSDADVLTSGHAFVLSRVDEDDDEIASSATPIDRRFGNSASSQKFNPPTKESMMKLHDLLVGRLRPLTLRRRGQHSF